MVLPHISLSVDNDKTLTDETFKIIKHLYPEYEIGNFIYKIFTAGVTNKLVGWHSKDCGPEDMLLVKVYGHKTELFIDRNDELEALKALNANGLPPKLMATFNNGYVYVYIHGESVTLQIYYNYDLISLAPKLFAQIHRLRVNIQKGNSSCMWEKNEKFINEIPDERDTRHASNTVKFLKLFRGGKASLTDEFKEIKNRFKNTSLPVVFCHNDASLVNMVYHEGNVSLIDYEYAFYNYQAWDVANHFAEFPGQDFDPTLYPAEDYQREWLKRYIIAYNVDVGMTDDEINSQTNALFDQAQQFLPTVHFFWATWSILQSYFSVIDYDYMDCAVKRFKEYNRFKSNMPVFENEI